MVAPRGGEAAARSANACIRHCCYIVTLVRLSLVTIKATCLLAFGLLSPISYAMQRGILLRWENPTYMY